MLKNRQWSVWRFAVEARTTSCGLQKTCGIRFQVFGLNPLEVALSSLFPGRPSALVHHNDGYSMLQQGSLLDCRLGGGDVSCTEGFADKTTVTV